MYPMNTESSKSNRELIIDFSLLGPIDLRTIKAGFLTQYNDYGNKIVAEPSYIHIHYKSKDTDQWKFLTVLDKYEDNGYCITTTACYQKNFMRLEGGDYKSRVNSVCIPKNIGYLRFIIGKPTISF